MVLSNTNTDSDLLAMALTTGSHIMVPFRLSPRGWVADSPLRRIVDASAARRAGRSPTVSCVMLTRTRPSGAGRHSLRPELTVASPFLNTNSLTQLQQGISEAVYERIPQQILSLLRAGEPRFVIYAFGQSLKPADRSIVTSGPFFGLCTNYQITAEVATRTVLRVEGSPNPVLYPMMTSIPIPLQTESKLANGSSWRVLSAANRD